MNHTSAASPDPTTTAGATAGTTGTREGGRGMQPRLDVDSIKMISTSCS
jgi:hypothetical protein